MGRVRGRGEAIERLKDVETLKEFDREGAGERLGEVGVVRVGVRGRLGAVEFGLLGECGALKEVEGVRRLGEGGEVGDGVERGVLK